MTCPDVKQFLDKCRDKEIDILELDHRGWRAVNSVNLHSIFWDGSRFTIEHNIGEELFFFEIEKVKCVSFGANEFNCALCLQFRDGMTYQLLHLKRPAAN